MHTIRPTSLFKKDIKKVEKQGRDMEKLKVVIDTLANGKSLPSELRDHKLVGNWKNHRECHLQSDWLLIYKIIENSLILVRTGSHSELFQL